MTVVFLYGVSVLHGVCHAVISSRLATVISISDKSLMAINRFRLPET
ncbi:MAG: hypothetical protein IJV35_11085 [Neisseriaceae bacterium]|nr:hypothetical protein [Neisseriaceae bacterium]